MTVEAFQYSELYLKNLPKKGRGVFTKVALPKGTVVEVAPVILLNAKDYATAESTFLYEYMYGWDKEGGAVALGYGSLYNHDKNPNLVFECLESEGLIRYTATRDIQADEELMINYCQRFNHEKLWFDYSQ